ncbi:hypothetical protein J14TS2_31750 [Bacillus sp. J14TS2]|uniref:DUF1697 domain-containing protein n=1 Tax=Bacillus sp. J14TS2 TaxID=2807188 RepID=UPI001B25001E|nr:DUF1697 domain-containing protein [Bacillus sp. J14TS2]GIN72700.1 hypothetical protein J14TS2_31750 [Bacillus sp. J14TS2]
MPVYIAFLRGINVGGHRKIKMNELRTSLEKIGLDHVQTYIQSGNVLFESNEKEEWLRQEIERRIFEDFGFSISVILRTATELEAIIANLPFPEEIILKVRTSSVGEILYVALLLHAPLQEKVERLDGYKHDGEDYQVVGHEVYFLFGNGARNSKLADQMQSLGVPTTVRNWKTLNKLIEMAAARKSV